MPETTPTMITREDFLDFRAEVRADFKALETSVRTSESFQSETKGGINMLRWLGGLGGALLTAGLIWSFGQLNGVASIKHDLEQVLSKSEYSVDKFKTDFRLDAVDQKLPVIEKGASDAKSAVESQNQQISKMILDIGRHDRYRTELDALETAVDQIKTSLQSAASKTAKK